jgi:hypothetical protein
LEGLHKKYASLRVDPEESLKRYQADGATTDVVFHAQALAPRFPHPISFISPRRRIRAKPGDQRDALHSELVDRLMEDIENHKTDEDLDARIDRILNSVGLEGPGTHG